MRRIPNLIKCSLAVLAGCFITVSTTGADVIHIDTSQVDPSALPAVKEAEAVWEARLKAYSTELPRGIRDQLGRLVIIAMVAPIDGPGGILGQAGPDAVLLMGRDPVTVIGLQPQVKADYAVSVRATMQFDLDDFPSLIADGTLVQVIAHEMGHALGFGTLFDGNGLTGPLGGFGATQYINGEYAIRGYRKDIGNPVAAYVPLEQRGGPGTALGHWIDAPPFFNQVFTSDFKKELMTGFLGDIDPNTGAIIYGDPFISNATWGAMADLGFAVEGINGAYAAEPGSPPGRWPKTTGAGVNPFDANAIPAAAGLSYNLVTVKVVYRDALGSGGDAGGEVTTEAVEDPYNLRRHRWVK